MGSAVQAEASREGARGGREGDERRAVCSLARSGSGERGGTWRAETRLASKAVALKAMPVSGAQRVMMIINN